MFARFLSLSLLLGSATLASSGMAYSQPLPDRRPLVGTVVDSEGKPVSGAFVTVRRQVGEGSFAFWGAGVSTDATGQFQFPQAETGRYYLNAELLGFAPVYNQSIIWKSGSPPLKVAMKKLVELRLTLQRPDDSPAANLPIWIRLRADGYAGQTTRNITTDGQGQLTVPDLQPGTYSVLVSSPAGYFMEDRIAVGRDARKAFKLNVGGALKVSLKDGGNPSRSIGGVTLLLTPQDQDEAVKLLGEAADTSEDFGTMAAMGKRLNLVSRDGDGSIFIENLPPGRYNAQMLGGNLAVSVSKPVTIKAGQTETVEWSVLPKASSKSSLEIQLSDSAGKPASGEFTVRMLPIAENGGLVSTQISNDAPGGDAGRRALANAAGKIALFPIVPGRYRFFIGPANALGPNGEPLEAAALDVTVPAGGTTASLVLKGTS